jgi:hypothetical protein
VRRLALAAALVAIPSLAHADPIEQENQLVFGVMGTYLPAQNNLLGTDILGIGHYMAYTHSLDCLHVGFRITASFATGPQFIIDPDIVLGVHFHAGRLALRLEAGTGPLVNGGEGFATGVIDHTYARASAQLRIGKSVIVEAFGGPGFVIGANARAVMAEFGLGLGGNF